MEKLKSCLPQIQNDPDFYMNVEKDGEVIAVIRDLTPSEMSLRRKLAGYKYKTDDNGDLIIENDNPVIEIENIHLWSNLTILFSLGGKYNGKSHKIGDEGWQWEEEPTLELIDRLPTEWHNLFMEAVNKKLHDYLDNRKAISKN